VLGFGVADAVGLGPGLALGLGLGLERGLGVGVGVALGLGPGVAVTGPPTSGFSADMVVATRPESCLDEPRPVARTGWFKIAIVSTSATALNAKNVPPAR
jgi:hypothetical protein